MPRIPDQALQSPRPPPATQMNVSAPVLLLLVSLFVCWVGNIDGELGFGFGWPGWQDTWQPHGNGFSLFSLGYVEPHPPHMLTTLYSGCLESSKSPRAVCGFSICCPHGPSHSRRNSILEHARVPPFNTCALKTKTYSLSMSFTLFYTNVTRVHRVVPFFPSLHPPPDSTRSAHQTCSSCT